MTHGFTVQAEMTLNGRHENAPMSRPTQMKKEEE